jgi:hypothetical protein
MMAMAVAMALALAETTLLTVALNVPRGPA